MRRIAGRAALEAVRTGLALALTLALCLWLPGWLSPAPAPMAPPDAATSCPVSLPPPPPPRPAEAVNRAEPAPAVASAAAPAPPSLAADVGDWPLPTSTISAPPLYQPALPGLASEPLQLSQVDTAPVLLKYVAPIPPLGSHRGGKLRLRLLVSEGGAVLSASVRQASPQGVFETAALEAARQWRFEPARLQGEAVAVYVDVPLNFQGG